MIAFARRYANVSRGTIADVDAGVALNAGSLLDARRAKYFSSTIVGVFDVRGASRPIRTRIDGRERIALVRAFCRRRVRASWIDIDATAAPVGDRSSAARIHIARIARSAIDSLESAATSHRFAFIKVRVVDRATTAHQ